MAGIFDEDMSPGQQAMLALGLGLMGNQGPVGPSIARAGAGALDTLTHARKLAQEAQMRQAQIAEMQQQARVRDMQIAEMQAKARDAEAVRNFWANPSNYTTPATTRPQAGPTVDMSPGLPDIQVPAGVMNPRQIGARMLASGSPALAQEGVQLAQKGATPVTVAKGATIGSFDDSGQFTPAYTSPDLESADPFAKLITERDKWPVGSPNWKLIQQRLETMASHAPPVSVNNYGPPIAVQDPNDPRKTIYVQPSVRPGAPDNIVTIPGTNKPAIKPPESKTALSPEQAAKVAMVEQGAKNIEDLSAKLFVRDQTGAVVRLNRSLLANLNAPFTSIGGEARTMRTAIRNAVEARLRLESGAAVPETEVNRAMDRFMPSPLDTVESAQYKLAQLSDFFTSSVRYTKVAPQSPLGQNAQGTAPPAAEAPSVNELVKRYGQPAAAQ